MAYYGISRDDNKSYEEIKKDMKEQLFMCLKKAFQLKPELIWHSKTERDLIWVKEKYKNEFDTPIGSVFNYSS